MNLCRIIRKKWWLLPSLRISSGGKVVGPVHKSDVGGVVLNIKSEQHLSLEFDRMMQIADAKAIMVQPMLRGTELFIGAKYEEKFGHVVLCGWEVSLWKC